MKSVKTSKAFVAFRQECHMYPEYLKEEAQLKQEINLEQYKINGVHSVRFEKTYRQSSRIYHSILHDVEVKTLIQEKLTAVQKKIGWVDECINAIPYPFHRLVAWRTYVMRDSFNDVAEDYEIDREHLRKMNKRLLKGVLNEERMQEYIDIDAEYENARNIRLRLMRDHVAIVEEEEAIDNDSAQDAGVILKTGGKS